MAFNEIFDETLDINSTVNYKLSIQAGLDGFYFTILDTLRNKFVLFRSYEPDSNNGFTPVKIETLIEDDDFLTRQFNSVTIMTPGPVATLVPVQLYDPAGRDDYLTLNSEPGTGRVTRLNKLSHPDSYLIFAVNGELSELIDRQFSGAEPVHHLKPLLYHLLSLQGPSAGPLLHLHVENDFINIVSIAGNTVKLCNSFTCRSTSDMLYYALYVAEKSGIKPSASVISASGAITRFDEKWTSLSGHFREVRQSQPSVKSIFSYVFSEELLHRHLNLFTLNHCV